MHQNGSEGKFPQSDHISQNFVLLSDSDSFDSFLTNEFRSTREPGTKAIHICTKM